MNDIEQRATTPAEPKARAWPLFLAGLFLFIAGPAAYMLRFNAKHLEMPWYMLILATAGVGLMVASVWRRRGVVRAVLLVLFVVACGFEWYGFVVVFRNPEYHGPAQLGTKIPQFATKLADGQPFSDQDLAKGGTTVLVFYRGHW